MLSLHNPLKNQLLGRLPESDYGRLRAHLELRQLKRGQIIYKPNQPATHVYFPLDCLISKVFALQDGSTGQIAIIGNDGCIGIDLIMGGEHASTQTMVLSAGHAYRLPARILEEEFAQARELQRILLRYLQALLIQIAQTTVCNRYHIVEHQLCRWLLMSLDRISASEVEVTHEAIASMLGVSRERVNIAARKLRSAGLISYAHGRILIVDRSGLEANSCECYQAVRQETRRLLAA